MVLGNDTEGAGGKLSRGLIKESTSLFCHNDYVDHRRMPIEGRRRRAAKAKKIDLRKEGMKQIEMKWGLDTFNPS